MRRTNRNVRALTIALLALMTSTARVNAQPRSEITISDAGVMPENLTSALDGTVYFGSAANGTIYRATPGATRAEPWILSSTTGLTNVLGVLADDRTSTLWVCQNTTGGRGGTPVSGQTALRSFDLKTGTAKGTYPFPANAGVCNDIVVSADNTVYATESFRGRIHRLRPGASALEAWVSAPETFNAIDGIAILADGSLYVNDFFNGKLFRVPVNSDGSAGTIVPIESSLPFRNPDGLRTAGVQTLLQAEGQGRLTEITVNGNRADVRVIREGLTSATGVTVVGGNALVLIERARALVVPYVRR